MTLFTELETAGIPVISATEDGAISMGAMTLEQQELFSDILLEHFQPERFAQIQEDRIDVQNFKDNFQPSWNTLTTLEGKATFTQAEAAQAINFMAGLLKKIMKYIFRRLA